MAEPRGAQLFSADYATSRARFREAAQRAGFELAAYPIGQQGPDGAELAIDVARKGARAPRRVLVVSSGTHGVEGYFGAAVQLALLEGLFARATFASHLEVVLIHAMNPYGFAWTRRVNEDNVDQNRNFMLDGVPFSGAPEAYRELDGLLNPKSAPRRFEPFLLQAGSAVLRRGFRALKSAVATGQYDFPQGIFFGGHGPTRTQQILAAHARDWLGKPERVLHLDLHTGMGKWGSYALCIDLPAQSQRVLELRREFGPESVQGLDPNGVLYEIRGVLGRWLEQRFPQTQYDCLLAEFGTYAPLRVLSAMRLENRVHHHAPDRGDLVADAKASMLEAFAPRSPRWRDAVVARAVHVVEQALSALSVSASGSLSTHA